jgi:GNAT superfamily N-acetyltransferase
MALVTNLTRSAAGQKFLLDAASRPETMATLTSLGRSPEGQKALAALAGRPEVQSQIAGQAAGAVRQTARDWLGLGPGAPLPARAPIAVPAGTAAATDPLGAALPAARAGLGAGLHEAWADPEVRRRVYGLGGALGGGALGGGLLGHLAGGALSPDDEKLPYEERRRREWWRNLATGLGTVGGGVAAPWLAYRLGQKTAAADFAPGLPAKDNLGPFDRLRVGQLLDYIVQRHDAERAGLHHDIRIGNPDLGLLSWAARKGVPGPGQKHLAVRQPVHSHGYKDFEGRIESGYGAGTVTKADEGKVLLTKVTPESIHFTTAHGRYPERFTLARPKNWGGRNWLLMNTTPRSPAGYEKLHYKSIPAEQVEPALKAMQESDTLEAKVDGASQLIRLAKGHAEALSYRTSKTTGGPIVHSERLFGGRPEIKVPPHLEGSVLKGELYAADPQGRAGTAQDVGTLLNSGVARSLQLQKERGHQLRTMLYDIQRHGKTDIDPSVTSRDERRRMLAEVAAYLPADKFHLSEEARGPEAATKLWNMISSGQHPLSREGGILWPQRGVPVKAKIRPDFDVVLRGIFPGAGKRSKTVGGFVYSHTPEGPIVGRVGTGFDESTLAEAARDPGAYIGRMARLQAHAKLPSGALREPSFIGLHEDYNSDQAASRSKAALASDARPVSHEDIRDLAQHGPAVHRREPSGLSGLWRPGDHGLRSLAEVRGVPGGHGSTSAGPDPRTEGQQRPVLAGQLQVGDQVRTGEEPSHQPASDSRRVDASGRGLGGTERDQSRHHQSETIAGVFGFGGSDAGIVPGTKTAAVLKLAGLFGPDDPPPRRRRRPAPSWLTAITEAPGAAWNRIQGAAPELGAAIEEQLEKPAAAHPALASLLVAKARSDRRNYAGKHAILSRLLDQHPGEFVVDSSERGMLGLTHVPTNFRIHAPASMVRGRAKAAAAAPEVVYSQAVDEDPRQPLDRIDAHVAGRNVGYLTSHPSTEGDGTWLKGLKVAPRMRGQGVGAELMRRAIAQYGDRPLRLRPRPYAGGPLGKDRLAAWYGGMGFVPYDAEGRMVRHPEKAAAFTATNTVSRRGRTYDIDALVARTEGRPVERISLGDVEKPDRSSNTGFSRKRYVAVDMQKPILVGHDGTLWDGRHRLARHLDEGKGHIQAVRVTPADLDAVTLDKGDGPKGDPIDRSRVGLLPEKAAADDPRYWGQTVVEGGQAVGNAMQRAGYAIRGGLTGLGGYALAGGPGRAPDAVPEQYYYRGEDGKIKVWTNERNRYDDMEDAFRGSLLEQANAGFQDVGSNLSSRTPVQHLNQVVEQNKARFDQAGNPIGRAAYNAADWVGYGASEALAAGGAGEGVNMALQGTARALPVLAPAATLGGKLVGGMRAPVPANPAAAGQVVNAMTPKIQTALTAANAYTTGKSTLRPAGMAASRPRPAVAAPVQLASPPARPSATPTASTAASPPAAGPTKAAASLPLAAQDLRARMELVGSRGRALRYGRPEPAGADRDYAAFVGPGPEREALAGLMGRLRSARPFAYPETGAEGISHRGADYTLHRPERRALIDRAWALQEQGVPKDEAWRQVDKSAAVDDSGMQPYQSRIGRRVAGGENLLVYHGLGSGKTRSAIEAAKAVGGPYTALTPASLRTNFQTEVGRWDPGAAPDILSYTGVGMGKQPTQAPSTVIMDEVQRLRNPASAGSRAAMDLAMQAPHRVLLSGTPIVNAPSDLAVPLSILSGEKMSPDAFTKKFVGSETVDPGFWGWMQGVQPAQRPAIQNEADLERLLEGHVDYQPSRAPEGVKTHDERVEVDLGPEQQDFYKLMWGRLPWLTRWKLSNDYPMSSAEIAHLSSFMTGPRQAALSLYPFHSSHDPIRAFQTSSKLQAAMTSLKQTLGKDPRAKAIIYSNFIDAGLTPYSAALTAAKIPHGLFHGAMTAEDQKKALDDYNAGKSRVLLLGPAAAEGISAKGTQLIQLLDPHWNEARLGQARGRGLRFDSHEGLPEELRNVKIQRFIARMPEPGFFGRLLGDEPRPSADEVLERQTQHKEELNEQFREVLRRVGSPGYRRPWSFFG